MHEKKSKEQGDEELEEKGVQVMLHLSVHQTICTYKYIFI